jgi:hypothetical protein
MVGSEEHSEKGERAGSGQINGQAQDCHIQNTRHPLDPGSGVNDPFDLVQSSKKFSGASALP